MSEENTAAADDGADAGTDTGAEGQDQGADNSAEGNDGADDGAGKSGNSMLDGLGDGDGVTFDFTGEEKPEGFPDEFWDAENKGVNSQALFDGLQKQEKIAKDLRSKMGKGEHKAPAKAEDYTLELPEEIASQMNEGDKTLAAGQKRAHEFGISQEAYQGFMSGMIGDLVAIAAEANNPDSETNETARNEYVQEQIKEIGPNGAQVLRAVEKWGKELLSDGRISEASLEAMTQEGMTSAPMVRFLNEMRSSMGGDPVLHDHGDDGLPPDAEIANMIDAVSNDAEQIKVDALLDRRRQAGRPDKLQF